MGRLKDGFIAGAILCALAAPISGCGDSDDKDADATSARAEAAAGDWRPWVLSTADEVSVPPPPADGSAAAKRDATGLEAAKGERTSEQEALARRYSAAPVVAPWLDQTMELVSRRPKDPPGSSRSYSYVSAAMADAVLAAYHWKYEYDRAAPKGDATVERSGDPSYPSEHAAMAGAASRVIAHQYPE